MIVGDLLVSRSSLVSGSTAIEHLQASTVTVIAETMNLVVDNGETLVIKEELSMGLPLEDIIVITEQNNDILLQHEESITIKTSEDIIYE